MALIEWSAALQLDLHEIDNQHQMLVAITNELDDAMRRGKGKYALGKILDGLSAYTVSHFETEEKYFRQFAYPETEDHTCEHNEFVSKVSDFWLEFAEGKRDLSIEVMNFLSDWLQQHIQISDRKFVGCFKANGLK